MTTQVLTNAIVPVKSPAASAMTPVAPEAPSKEITVVPVKETERQAMIVPAPQLNIIFVREGDMLRGIGHIIDGGDIKPIEARVNLPELARMLGVPGDVMKEDARSEGIFDDIGSAITSIAKSSIVKSIGKIATSAIKSKALGAAIGGLAIVFPPVGLPAAGAYASANIALKYIEDGRTAIKQGQKLLKSGKGLTPKDKQNLKKLIARKERAQAKLKKIAARGKQPPDPKLKQMQAAVHQKNRELKAQKSDRRLIPPISPRQYAQVIGLVSQSRRRIENVKQSLDIPQKVNTAPRVIHSPLRKNDSILTFWRTYLKSHPVKRHPAKSHPVIVKKVA